MTTPAGSSPSASLDGPYLVIGTHRTCRQVEAQLGTLGIAPAVSGWVVARHDAAGSMDVAPPGRVLGTLDELEQVLLSHRAPFTALVCFPSSHRASALRATSAISKRGIPYRVVPDMVDVLAGRGAAQDPARGISVDFSELIGRTPYGIDRKAVSRLIEGKTVLITGAGGSIGSVIAQIAATFNPARLVLMERAENALFEINRRIGERFPSLQRTAIMHDVVDSQGTLRHLQAVRPHVVFHAAAHKHVPLMEDHPSHAVTNNFFGTKSIADAALAAGAERFVLISSDKAVKPTSVMGATKRLAEMYIQGLHRSVWSRRKLGQAGGSEGKTSFCMVRFGNVLGSACSVLPIWTSQLSDGGPVTVTDPRMTRYFMTIDEAAALVIQAGAIETTTPTANVYVLDMGQPVRILDLARRFVAAAGFEPVVTDGQGARVEQDGAVVGHDLPPMQIRLTGARPGEKLHEELAYAAELLQPTPYPGINAWAGPLGDDFSLAALVSDLTQASSSTDRQAVLATIRRHVPELPNPSATPVQGTNLAAQTDLEPKQAPNMTVFAA